MDRALRPKGLNDFSGQQKIVNNLEIFIKAAKIREEALDHVLLHGPPGLGKTTLSLIIASEMGANMKMTSGPVLEKAGDLAGLLTNLEEGDVLFIDEIHRLNNVVEEYLYSAMEDYRLDIIIGQGPAARTMQIDIVPFTLIGATTRSGLLSNPLRDRFLAHLHFDFYSSDELKQIVINNSNKLNFPLDVDICESIAECSRGTPRVANRVLRRVRDFSIAKEVNKVDEEVLQKSLKLMEIDESYLLGASLRLGY